MGKKAALLSFLVGASCIVAPATDVMAISADVAKKCGALKTKAFPPRVPGNPAAGSAKGSGLEAQDYFQKCVANGGQPPVADEQKKSK